MIMTEEEIYEGMRNEIEVLQEEVRSFKSNYADLLRILDLKNEKIKNQRREIARLEFVLDSYGYGTN